MKLKKLWVEGLIFLTSVTIRLPSLGWDIFNTDSSLWKTRSYIFSTELFHFNFAGTALTAHPGVTLMWIGTVAIKFYHLVNRLFRPAVNLAGQEELFVFNFAVKLTLVLVISLLLSLSFSLLKKLLGSWRSFFAILILSLEPFFLAHTRVYHLDGLLAMFSFAAALFLLNFLFDKQNRGWLLGTAVFSSLAALTKLPGLFLLPFVGLLLGFCLLKRQLPLGKALKFFALYLLVFTLAFFVFWPAMWVSPVKTLTLYFSGISQEGFGGHRQFVLGHQTMDPGIIFYPLSLAIRLSPYFLAAFILGICQLVRSLSTRKKPLVMVLSVSLIFIFLYLTFITIPSKKLERYTIPIYPFMAVLAGVGLGSIKSKLDPYLKRGGFLLVFLLFLLFFLSSAAIHPDYLAYYSPLVGGYSSGVRLIYPRWHFGDAQLGRYLSSKKGAEDLIIAAYNHDQLPPFVPGKVISLGRDADPSEADYMVIPIWRVEREQELKELYNLELETIIAVGKNPVYKVFRVVRASGL